MAQHMDQHMERIQGQHPEVDLKLSSQWWMPAIDLGADAEESLDADTNSKVNKILNKAMESKFDPEVIKNVREELKTILVGQKDILKRIEDIIFPNEHAMAQMRQYIQQQEEKGSQAFPACSAKPGSGSYQK
ncbi:uncharacterized protein CTRU02_213588 [Colletotrichum truncatum]|uniref:Uncharacterized protein n=1 Tax=Colletotrichum truncatum TaxID=5467 RepID=A0ACC3YG77_COLTU